MPDIQLNIKVDKTGAVKNIDELRKELAKIQGGDSVQVKVDTDEAEKKVRSLGELLQQAVSLEAVSMLSDSMANVASHVNATVDSMKILKAQTGAIGADFEFLKDAAGDLYSAGVGDSYADAAKAIASAKRNLGDFVVDGNKGLMDFTKIAGGIAKVFDKDINEVIAGSRTFIANFKLEGQEAGELVAYAMQNASGKMDDVLDTLDEYSQLAVTAGYSAKQFTDIITRGMQAGLRDTDKLADAIKETQIRLNAGDTAKSLAEINAPVARSIEDIIKLGEAGVLTVQEVLQQSSREISSALEAGQISKALRDQLNTALSGTMAEDIGGELYSKIFSADFDTAELQQKAAEAAKLMEEAIAPKGAFESFQKAASVALDSAAASFSPVISSANTALQAVSGVAPAMILVGQAAPAVKTAATAMLGVEKATKLAALAQRALNLAMKAAPWALAAAAAGLLIYALIDLGDSYEELHQKEIAEIDAKQNQIKVQKELNLAKQQEEISTIKLVETYTSLANKSKLTAEEQQKLATTQGQLNEKYPGVIDKTKTFDQTLLSLSQKAGLSTSKLAELRGEFKKLTDQEFQASGRKLEAQLKNMRKGFKDVLVDSILSSSDIEEAVDDFIHSPAELLLSAFGKSKADDLMEIVNGLNSEMTEAINLYGKNAKEGATAFINIETRLLGISRINDEEREKLNKYVRDTLENLKTQAELEQNKADAAARGSSEFQKQAAMIDKTQKSMSTFENKKSYTDALDSIKAGIESLGKVSFEGSEFTKLKSMIDDAKNAYKKSTEARASDEKAAGAEAERIRKEALAKQKAAQEAYDKFIEESLKREQGLYSDHYDRVNQSGIDALEDRKKFINESNQLAIDQVKELIDIEGRLRDLTIDEIGVTLSIQDDPAQMNKQIAERLKADIEAVREREKEALKLQSAGTETYEKIRIQANKEIEALEKDAIGRHTTFRLKTERETQQELKRLRAQEADIRARDAINAITDINEQEYAIAVSAAKKTFEARLDEVRGNYSLEYKAFTDYQNAKIEAEELYLDKTKGLFEVSAKEWAASFQSALAEGLQLPDTGNAKDQLDGALADLTSQSDGLIQQYRNQEISRGEFHKRMNELDKARNEASREFKEVELTNQKAIILGMSESFKGMYDLYSAKHAANVDEWRSKNAIIASSEKDLQKSRLEAAEALAAGQFKALEGISAKQIALTEGMKQAQEDAAKASDEAWANMGLSFAASMGQMLAAGIEVMDAFTLSVFQAMKQLISTYILEIYATSIAWLGPIAGPVTATALIGGLYGLMAKAEADIKKKYELGGLVEGTQQAIIVNERGPEFVMKASTTAKNLPAFDYINQHDITVEEYVRRNSGFKSLMFTPRKEDAQPVNVHINMKQVEDRLERIEKKLGKYRIESENNIGIKMSINDKEIVRRIEIENAKNLIGI